VGQPNQEVFMKNATGESWKTLCEQATTEQDPKKLLELIREINRLLEEERFRLYGENDAKGPYKY
jgi:hypothetical protein